MSWGRIVFSSILIASVSAAHADLVQFDVFPAYAPSASGTGWSGYVPNAISGITGGSGAIVGPGRNVDPATYEPTKTPIPPYELIVTDFESWRGKAAPTVFDGTPNVGTRGNRQHFGLHISTTADMPFSLQDISYEIDSDDFDDFFDLSGSFSSANYSDTRIGINYGPNGVLGGGDDIVYQNGESGALPIHDLRYVGVGTAFQALKADAATPQDAIDDTLRSILSGCDGCDVTLTGRYVLDASVLGQEVIRSADVIIRIEPGFGGDFDRNGTIDCTDIDLLTMETAAGTNDKLFDLNSDNLVNFDDIETWVNDIKHTYFGDANCDLEFNSTDLIKVFQAAKYETGQPAKWSEGDNNGDGVFNSSDLIVAFIQGGYEKGPRPSPIQNVPEPAALGLLLTGAVALFAIRRRRS